VAQGATFPIFQRAAYPLWLRRDVWLWLAALRDTIVLCTIDSIHQGRENVKTLDHTGDYNNPDYISDDILLARRPGAREGGAPNTCADDSYDA
jgi:hypothetical protein